MKKVITLLTIACGVLAAQTASACTAGQQGIGYVNRAQTESHVSIDDLNTGVRIYADSTVPANGSYYEFCWTKTSDDYKVTQNIASTASYVKYTKQDFIDNDFFINVTSDSGSWTTV